MIVLLGLAYIIYFLVLGAGFRQTVNLLIKNKWILETKTEFVSHAFFQGVFFHVLLFNTLQLFNWSVITILIIIILILVAAILLIAWHASSISSQLSFKWLSPPTALFSLACACALLIYWNGHMLPNIAWDSWAVWEGRAQQWVLHGLNTDIHDWDEWLLNHQSIYNHAANYPDGLSLIYYLPMLLSNDGFAITYVVNLFAFTLISMLMVQRLAKNNGTTYLQAFAMIALFTTPMINNHLMIQGYADIWMAMYIMLLLLTLVDCKESKRIDTGIALICYLFILPMLKLEGWIWLLLFAVAYVLVNLWQHKKKYWITAFTLIFAFLFASNVINFHFPFGDLVINQQRIVIFNLIDTPIQFQNITDQLLTSFLWQNNWSIIWLGLPFLMVTFLTQRHDQAYKVAQTFFISALLCFLFLFYFTEASKWALDLTAINRLILQLTPCYLFLLFNMLIKVEHFHPEQKGP